MSLAKINGLFRLTRDAELRYSASGSEIVRLGLACNEKYKDKETQLFIDAVAFGKLGELISKYAGSKGTQIYLSGKLQTETWQDKQSGQNISKVSMIIESMDFVSNKSYNGQANQESQQWQYQPQGRPVPPAQQPNVIDVDEDEIPF